MYGGWAGNKGPEFHPQNLDKICRYGSVCLLSQHMIPGASVTSQPSLLALHHEWWFE